MHLSQGRTEAPAIAGSLKNETAPVLSRSRRFADRSKKDHRFPRGIDAHMRTSDRNRVGQDSTYLSCSPEPNSVASISRRAPSGPTHVVEECPAVAETSAPLDAHIDTQSLRW